MNLQQYNDIPKPTVFDETCDHIHFKSHYCGEDVPVCRRFSVKESSKNKESEGFLYQQY